MKVHEDGLRKIVWARDMDLWYGSENVDHFIDGYGNDNNLVWNSVAYIHERYELTLQVAVEIDYRKCKLKSIGKDPKVFLHEISSLSVGENGEVIGAIMRSKGLKQEYNVSKLMELKLADGSLNVFSTDKEKVKLNSPIERYQEYRRIWGKDRVKVN